MSRRIDMASFGGKFNEDDDDGGMSSNISMGKLWKTMGHRNKFGKNDDDDNDSYW
eukprot:CAMPEP_0113299742 /NCGR_PEP_ID=MMETSP0010_2-20120614/1654_1 /TAXON_ID=216773 ORGANISM="Corethron hystrix, Strain 308" /NCGR_SAMPLE_ID=MMETSP0010_2 /ASSEMBLY_ACC=CAM_ASM_000155 /LENGTH=54 /DNA_ID=CAMNT_0000153035 /DNA_START=54 /DNA_END=218 /DNA_ORIENTATION=+ /assembly_acc=CAM_ASM_000155